MKEQERQKSNDDETLGHGSHWEAIGLGDLEKLLTFIVEAVQKASVVKGFRPPWPESPFAELLHHEWPQASLLFASIEGVSHEDRTLRLLSAFPVLTHTSEWIVNVDEVLDSYGPFEGVVAGQTASGHPLQWFAPRFGLEVDHWRGKGLARVAFAALATSLGRFAAEPILVREGPLVEEHREELRNEGKITEAESADLSVEVLTEKIRTFFSSFHDHHEFVGKVMEVRIIRPRPEFQGWRLDLECLPDELETGSRLPLYVFPPAIEPGYQPKRGDLIQGIAWLQGTWKGLASPEDVALWNHAAGESPQS